MSAADQVRRHRAAAGSEVMVLNRWCPCSRPGRFHAEHPSRRNLKRRGQGFSGPSIMRIWRRGVDPAVQLRTFQATGVEPLPQTITNHRRGKPPRGVGLQVVAGPRPGGRPAQARSGRGVRVLEESCYGAHPTAEPGQVKLSSSSSRWTAISRPQAEPGRGHGCILTLSKQASRGLRHLVVA